MAYDPEWAAVIGRAQHACVDIAAVRDELAVTRAETQRLIALARQGFVVDGWGMHGAATPVIAEELPDNSDPHALAMEVLRMMRELLSGFSAEWQVKIVKAITARTMLVVAAQLQKKPITPTA
jgi:hypothetical protein